MPKSSYGSAYRTWFGRNRATGKANALKKYLNKGSKRLPAPAKQGIKRIVKQEMKKEAEKKFVAQTSTEISFNSAITSTGEMYNVLPELTVGSDSYQRNGDEVQPTYLILDYQIRISSTATLPQPKIAYIFIIEDLLQRNSNFSSTANFLQSGDSLDVTNFDGTWATAMLPIDTTRFKLIKKIKVKLTQQVMAGSTQTQYVDNDGKATLIKNVRVRLPMSGKLNYPDSSYVVPQNRNILWCCGYVNYNQTTDNALADCAVKVNKKLYFRDF